MSRVRGYRAATFSIGARNQWAFGVLEEEGYEYSSSINPISHDLYGMPDAPRVPYRPGGRRLCEIPMTTVRPSGRNFPCSGGGYFRLLPYPAFRFGLSSVNRRGQARRVLFPSLGDRSGAAAHRQLRLEVALPALQQPVAHGRSARSPAARFRLGSHGSGVRRIAISSPSGGLSAAA